MRILVNHTNHPSEGWSEEQKRGWSEIIDVPFPAVDPTWELSQVEELVEKNIKEMKHELSIIVAEPNTEVWLCALGEYTYVYSLYKKLLTDPFVNGLAVPTTQRVIIEEDGGKKTSIFRFVRWRLLPLKTGSMEKPFTIEEWAEFRGMTLEKAKRYDFFYERDIRIAEAILKNGAEGIIRILENEIFPENAGHMAFRISEVYQLLKKKGLV